MGLLDILNGMQNGPHGQPQPKAPGGGSGGMSPIVMAILGLLAYKAMNSVTGHNNTTAPNNPSPPNVPNMPRSPNAPQTAPSGGGLGDILGGLFGGGNAPRPGGSTSGGLSDLIPGGLGGLLSGGNAGNVLSGGLGNLIRDLQGSGQGRTVQSWVGTGENETISPRNLEDALGANTIDTLSQQTGMNRDELLTGLSQHLPNFVDQMTPDGRVPTREELGRMI